MILASALDIFGRDGFAFLSRWSHVFVGITWIGLLYFFNFVQVPAYAEMEGSGPQQRHRQAHVAGVVVVPVGGRHDPSQRNRCCSYLDPKELYESDYIKTAPGVAIYAGILLAVTMFLNVWLVIWPNQKIVIANARNVQAGGEADPAAAAAGAQGTPGLAA